MLTNVFENRNRYFANLIKLGDFLGRSIRENIELFSIDGNEATFITESNKVLKGTFDPSKPHLLQNIKVESTDIFENKDEFSKIVDNKVSNFLSNVIENDLITAENSFDDVLKLWELRLQFDVTKKKLNEKSQRLQNSKITETEEFKRVLETKDLLVNYLKTNSKVISKISEVKNAIKLASAISECFNLPKIDLDSLNESTYKIPGRVTQNLYEHLTKSELISKELNESKESFNSIWSTRDEIVNLAAMIYEQDNNKVYESLAQTIHTIPYFAFATKKQLTESFRTVLSVLEQDYSEVVLKKFVSLIYESKKPVKNYLVSLLNEKYGINVANLTEVPTFSTLANTEALIFEALSLMTPKKSNLRRVLSEMAEMLKDKNGVDTIDVADFLNEVFAQAQYKTFINETSLMNYLDFNRVADDLGKIGAVLKMIQGNMKGGAGDLMGQDIGGLTQALQPEGEEEMTDDDQYGAEIDAPEGSEEEMPEEDMASDMGEEMPEEDAMAPEGEDNDDVAAPTMDSEDAAAEAMGMGGEEGEEEEVPEQDNEELLGNLKELEDLIAQLKGDIGVEDEAFAGEETPEEEAMEDHEMGEENEEDEGDGDVNIDVDTSDADADSDSDDDEVHIDIDSHKDEEDADEEEEEEEEGEDEEEDEEEKQEESSHEGLIGKQHRIDVNKNGELDKNDFKMLRKGRRGKK